MSVPQSMLKNAEAQIRACGRKGLTLRIGSESAAIQQLVEDGVIYREIDDGDHYKYTHPDAVDRKRKARSIA